MRDIVSRSTAVVADRSTRLAAAILDTLVMGAMVYSPLLLIAFGAPAAGPERAGTMAGVAMLLALVGFIVWGCLTLVYAKRNGQTIAKKMLGIKVVRSDGTPISLGRLFWLRNVVNALISVIPFYAFIDVLFIFGESKRCLHDKIADTMVVKA